MALLIGGPAHGRVFDIKWRYLIVPVFNNAKAPKQIRRSGGLFIECKYERTPIVKNGERIYRFVSGYYA